MLANRKHVHTAEYPWAEGVLLSYVEQSCVTLQTVKTATAARSCLLMRKCSYQWQGKNNNSKTAV